MRVLVTGASGYVGRAVLRDLAAAGHDVRAGTRSPEHLAETWRARAAVIPDIGPETDWHPLLEGIEAVIHLAVPATTGEPECERVIAAGTTRLVAAAAETGVRRVVFMSSVKAVGESTPAQGVDETVACVPQDAYGRAKLRAEHAVAAAALETVILRPPAVYGPGSGGNLRRIFSFLRSAPPVLPLGLRSNRRSFVHRDTLSAAVVRCLEHPGAAGRTFFVTDGEALSTAELVRRVLDAWGRRALLLPVPAMLLRLAGGGGRRLADSLAFDDRAIRSALGWSPPRDPLAGFADAVRAGEDPLQGAGGPGEPC